MARGARLALIGLLLAQLCPRVCIAQHPAVDALTEVVIYTKSIPPFSSEVDDGSGQMQFEGLTIDFLTRERQGVLAILAARNERALPTVRSVKLDGNERILWQVGSAEECNATLHPRRLCLGAAAISITYEREKDFGVDFLPSYFMSGLRIMVKEDTHEELAAFAEDIFYVLASAAVYWGSVILVITPLVWTSESYWCPPGKISIFHHCALPPPLRSCSRVRASRSVPGASSPSRWSSDSVRRSDK